MGIGDLLRSSAAWAALKAKWPGAQLHFLMLSKHAGYASQDFIRAHHLLASASFITVKSGQPGQPQRSLPYAQVVKQVVQAMNTAMAGVAVDMVIDCEPYGIRTSRLARHIAKQHEAISVGIAQFPLRSWFYSLAAPSVPRYMAAHQLSAPMDYTERDFVALAALGIQREGKRIELQVGVQGKAWQQQHAHRFAGAVQQVALNIGCGTADALPKRPDMGALVSAMVCWYLQSPFVLHLTGADFESAVNEEFMAQFTQSLKAQGLEAVCTNWAGKCTLNELAGLIALTQTMVSTDSGPYHMAVALGVPVVCWFKFATPASYHLHDDVAVLVEPTPQEFAQAALRLSRAGRKAQS
jgi:Glycosyltransferase family 9 (heptosyltransferase)